MLQLRYIVFYPSFDFLSEPVTVPWVGSVPNLVSLFGYDATMWCINVWQSRMVVLEMHMNLPSIIHSIRDPFMMYPLRWSGRVGGAVMIVSWRDLPTHYVKVHGSFRQSMVSRLMKHIGHCWVEGDEREEIMLPPNYVIEYLLAANTESEDDWHLQNTLPSGVMAVF